ncbi:MAG: transcription factor S [Candidatus Hadarchaeota archaeon]
MQFCKKCGSLMLPKKIDGDVFLTCTSCGHSVKAEGSEEYKMVKKSEDKEEVTVVEEKSGPALPTTRAHCPKCGHGTAYWWMRQTRAGDEPATRFYRCVKCAHTWREYT